MKPLSASDITTLFLAVSVLVAAARVCGELARRLNQPEVFGEILAGIVLGPTVLGAFAPSWSAVLFAPTGAPAVALDAFTTLGIALFLLVAGMEVNLPTIVRQRRAAAGIAISSVAVPFALGLSAAWLAPEFFGRHAGVDRLVFALFIAIALSVSALPVIAKTLMDLGIYRSDLGMVVMAAAFLNDLVAWIIFGVILGMAGGAVDGAAVTRTAVLTVGCAVALLTVLRPVIHRAMVWVQAHTSWPAGMLGFVLTSALVGGALAEWAGVHAVVGAFLVGVVIGDSPYLRDQTRATIKEFVSSFFAPLFFATIGLRTDYIAHFDARLTLVVLTLATAGTVLGCRVGARLSGMTPREAWAAGFGMNARGAMEIVLGLVALRYGLIGEHTFVALVLLALVTSMATGPVMRHILRLQKRSRFVDYVHPRAFLERLQAREWYGALRELSRAAIAVAGLEAARVRLSLVPASTVPLAGDREGASRLVGSAETIDGLAVFSGEVDQLGAPVVGIGLARDGIALDASGGRPVGIVFLVLIPAREHEAHQHLFADIARTFTNTALRERVLRITSYREFLALLNSEPTT